MCAAGPTISPVHALLALLEALVPEIALSAFLEWGSTQRDQDPLIQEHSLNHNMQPFIPESTVIGAHWVQALEGYTWSDKASSRVVQGSLSRAISEFYAARLS